MESNTILAEPNIKVTGKMTSTMAMVSLFTKMAIFMMAILGLGLLVGMGY